MINCLDAAQTSRQRLRQASAISTKVMVGHQQKHNTRYKPIFISNLIGMETLNSQYNI